VFSFPLQFLSETFLILRRTEGDVIKNVCCKVPFIFVRFLIKLLVFSTYFRKKHSKTKFHENPSSGSRVVPCGQTDGQTWRS